jgi:hypothetical protein
MNFYVRPIFSKQTIEHKDYKKLGSSNLYFNTIEIITRNKKKINKKFIKLKDIRSLEKKEFKEVSRQIKEITIPRKKNSLNQI